jgi:hypothetical protein
MNEGLLAATGEYTFQNIADIEVLNEGLLAATGTGLKTGASCNLE